METITLERMAEVLGLLPTTLHAARIDRTLPAVRHEPGCTCVAGDTTTTHYAATTDDADAYDAALVERRLARQARLDAEAAGRRTDGAYLTATTLAEESGVPYITIHRALAAERLDADYHASTADCDPLAPCSLPPRTVTGRRYSAPHYAIARPDANRWLATRRIRNRTVT